MDLPSSCTPDRVSPHPQATSLVLKRLPPRCTTAILLQVLDDIADDQYDYVHLPLDHQTNKNMSLAFLNFTNHEAADRAFNLLRRPSDFPDAFAPSTKAIWGAIHGLGPNLAHFIARYGFRALDPPYAPLIFENGKCVPRTQDVLRKHINDEMIASAAEFLQSRKGIVELTTQGDAPTTVTAVEPQQASAARARKSLRDILEELSDKSSYPAGGYVVFQL